MRSSTPRHISSLLLFCALFALLSTTIAARATPAAAAPTSITAAPDTLALSIPLGQSSSTSVNVTNASDSPLLPTILEAYPAAPPALFAARARRAVALPQQAERVDTRLLAELQAVPSHSADFLVFMHDQPDLREEYQIKDWNARGRYVYQTLVDYAEASQRGLRQQLAARGLRARTLWIVNAALVHGSQADVQALAGRADVALIRTNHTAAIAPPSLLSDTLDRCNPAQPGDTICWNVRQIGADRVWRDFGITGQGIVVANIDTGVRFDHPALLANYRGTLGGGRFDHNYNWFDPQGVLPAPVDSYGHGTHTMGTMVASGDSSAGLPSVGVAPGARWIAALGCASGYCSEGDLIESAQWTLAPTNLYGEQPRPDLRPLIVNNSWAGEGDDSWYAGYTAAWRAAGIFPVFAAGNSDNDVRQVCGSIKSPGDYADVVAVGATDQNDVIAGFSLLGPTADKRRKPDFVAPGSYSGAGFGVLSTYPGDGADYQVLRGTSMAAPMVSGLVALLWSANPALIGDYDTTYALLRDSAHELSDTRCGDAPGAANNVYGYGRIDAYAAVARARVDVPWLSVDHLLAPLPSGATSSMQVTLDAARVPGPGVYSARLQLYGSDLTQAPTTIEVRMTVTPAAQQAVVTGRVVSGDTGAPIAATVGVKDGLGVQTDSSGVYTLTLASGSYELVATAPAFLPAALALQLGGDQRAPDIVMQPDQPRLALSTAVLSSSLALGQPQTFNLSIANTGTRPLYYHVRVLPDQFAFVRSDQAGGPQYAWVDLPPSAHVLRLGDQGFNDDVPLGMDFPFYSYILTNTLVTADGTLSFSAPSQQYQGPLNPCFPIKEFHFFVLAPFRADLDPSKGGTIRYATIDQGATFVLSYEDIPLHGGPVDHTYSFQVLLHSDGRIGFQYRKLAALPSSLSVGIQYSDSNFQELGCGVATPLADQLAIELRPQPKATQWLHAPIEDGMALPKSQQAITLTLDWIRPHLAEIERGRIEVTSNDPLHSPLIIPVQVQMLQAPHEIWLMNLRK